MSWHVWHVVVNRYLETRRSRCYSSNTVDIEAKWLRRLADHCQALHVNTVEAATREHLALFHQALLWHPGATGRPYSARTVDQALRVARSFFRWAMTEQLVLVDPTRSWVLPRILLTTRPLLSVAELQQLLEVPNLRRPIGLRDRAILETLYATGIRRAECCNLDLHDIDLATQTLCVRAGKGARDRWLPMGVALTTTLTRYLADARPHLASKRHETALFLDRHGLRLSTQRYNQMVRKTGLEIGLQVSPHLLRHACATHLLEAGADLTHIQALLGHEHVSSTQLYTHLCPTEVKRMHHRTHPRAERQPPAEPPQD